MQREFKTTVSHIDTCLSCYLTDHHNRDGELLLGVSVDGSTSMNEVLDSLIAELNGSDFGRNPPADAEDAIKAAFADVDPSTVFDSSLEPASEDDDEDEGDSCSAWFLLTWDPADVIAEEREQNETKARAAGFDVVALGASRFVIVTPAGEMETRENESANDAWFNAAQEAEKALVRAARVANGLEPDSFDDAAPVRTEIELPPVNFDRFCPNPVALVFLPWTGNGTHGITIAQRNDDGLFYGCRDVSGDAMATILEAWANDAREKGLPIQDPFKAATRLFRERAEIMLERWHNTCRRANEGNASGPDMALTKEDAERALKRAELCGVDVSDIRAAHGL